MNRSRDATLVAQICNICNLLYRRFSIDFQSAGPSNLDDLAYWPRRSFLAVFK